MYNSRQDIKKRRFDTNMVGVLCIAFSLFVAIFSGINIGILYFFISLISILLAFSVVLYIRKGGISNYGKAIESSPEKIRRCMRAETPFISDENHIPPHEGESLSLDDLRDKILEQLSVLRRKDPELYASIYCISLYLDVPSIYVRKAVISLLEDHLLIAERSVPRKVAEMIESNDPLEATKKLRGYEPSVKLNKAGLDAIKHSRTSQSDSSVIIGNVHVGDTVAGDKQVSDTYINKGQTLNQGPHGDVRVGNVRFNQAWDQAKNQVDLAKLAAELATLHSALEQKAEVAPEYSTEIVAVEDAQQYAQAGDGPNVLKALSRVGGFTLDVAKTVGTPILEELIKRAMGLNMN